LKTCLALAATGVEVCLVTAGGLDIGAQAALLGHKLPGNFAVHCLSRRLGPIKSAAMYAWRFRRWLETQPPFDLAYAIHLKAARLLEDCRIPYWWEAHEVFADTPPAGSARQRRLAELERFVLEHAAGRVATSHALAEALNCRYFSPPLPFAVIPNAGDPPLGASLADPTGPLVYAGSLEAWKGLSLALEAAAQVGIAVRVVGGTAVEWQAVLRLMPSAALGVQMDWRPRVPLSQLPELLKGCRAGIIPTSPDTGSGRYSCPMKLFDYARCGLPTVATALPALQSLAVGSWCRLVQGGSLQAWKRALQEPPTDGAAAMQWAASHTWAVRAQQLLKAFGWA
jgi:glycosyltransferase involved in cell wall biosynthesis